MLEDIPDFEYIPWTMTANWTEFELHLKKMPEEILLRIPNQKEEVRWGKASIERAWDLAITNKIALKVQVGRLAKNWRVSIKGVCGPTLESYQAGVLSVEHKFANRFTTGSHEVGITVVYSGQPARDHSFS